MNGVVLINKEKEYTSFDVVAVVRKLTGQKKAGHTGTLDPNATGVLPVLLGTATKAQDIIPCRDKSYRADFRFGVATDTLDIWGEVLEEKPANVTVDQLEEALRSFRGEIEQLPPMYSAVSVDGKRLYQYAREGREVERRPRKVTVYSLELSAFDESTQSGTLDIRCSNGTYVRTGYRLDECMTLGELRQRIESGDMSFLRSVESIFTDYDELVVSDKQAHRFVNGNPLDIARTELRNGTEDKKIYRVKDRQGAFLSLGIVDVDKDVLKMYKHF